MIDESSGKCTLKYSPIVCECQSPTASEGLDTVSLLTQNYGRTIEQMIMDRLLGGESGDESDNSDDNYVPAL